MMTNAHSTGTVVMILMSVTTLKVNFKLVKIIILEIASN